MTADDIVLRAELATYEGQYICMGCGEIPVANIDSHTEFLDLHCKCGAPVIRVDLEVMGLYHEREVIEEIK